MSASRLLVLAVVLMGLAGGLWLALRVGDKSGDGHAGQPQTPTALGAADQARALEAATPAIRKAMQASEFEGIGQPRGIELVSLSASRDSEGNWYGKLWRGSGTGMTAEGKPFTWTLELANEGGQWSSAGAPSVDLKR